MIGAPSPARKNLRLIGAAIALICAIVAPGCSPKSPTPTPVPMAPSAEPAGQSKIVEGIQFESVADRAGLSFRWKKQARPMRNLEAFGCGCAFLDYDNDGWQDILLVAEPHPVLYRNLHNGKFEDVTNAVGLSQITGDWKGCGVGDYDGDGRLDIVLTGYRRLALLHNDGSRFTDVTTKSRLDPTNRNHWGSSAGFMDLTGTGKLDLVILNYVIFNEHEKQFCEDAPGIKTGCAPSYYRAEYGELWQNTGHASFRDVTVQSGMKTTHGKALVVAFADVYGDGKMSFYIGNDGMPADLMRNRGNLRFENAGQLSGLAHGVQDHDMAAMGADWADYDCDGRLDLAVTDFSNQPYSLFHAVGSGLFEQASESTGISGPTYKPLGFGAKWIDMDNDAWPDILFTNGHVYDRTQDVDPTTSFREPMMLFRNEHGKQFTDLVPMMGGAVAQDILGRGSATGDFDNDGRIDFLVVDYEGSPLLFHNQSQTANHWITLDLRGKAPNNYAYGAQVTIWSGKKRWVGQVSPASSYLSSSDPRVHFGLGSCSELSRIDVRWSNGERQSFGPITADRILILRQGQSKPNVSQK